MLCEQGNQPEKPSYRVDDKDVSIPCYSELHSIRELMRRNAFWMDAQKFYWLKYLYDREVKKGVSKSPLTPEEISLIEIIRRYDIDIGKIMGYARLLKVTQLKKTIIALKPEEAAEAQWLDNDKTKGKATKVRLDFFFFTNTADHASLLANELMEMKYSVKYGPSEYEKGLYEITGMTGQMSKDRKTIIGWVKKMCGAGRRNSCDFGGWGYI